MTIARIQNIRINDQFIEITESDDQITQIARETLSAQNLITTYGMSESKLLLIEPPSEKSVLFVTVPTVMLIVGSFKAIAHNHPILAALYVTSLLGSLILALGIATPRVRSDCETAFHNMHLLSQALPKETKLAEHEHRLNQILHPADISELS